MFGKSEKFKSGTSPKEDRNFMQQFKNAIITSRAKKKSPGNVKVIDSKLSEKMACLMKKLEELERNNFDDMVAHLIMTWSVCVLSIVMLRGLGYLELSDNVLIALASSPFISTCLAFFERRIKNRR